MVNEHALLNGLCPYCSENLIIRNKPGVCFQCNNNVSWIMANETNINGNIVFGSCKPGEEQQATKLLDEMVPVYRERARGNAKSSAKVNLIIFIVGAAVIIAVPLVAWFIFKSILRFLGTDF